MPACPGITGDTLSLIAGALIPFALAPYNIWLLSILSPLLLLTCLQNINSARALLRGWLFGLGLYGAGASWVYVSIHQYGHAPAPLAFTLTCLFVAFLALLFTASFSWCYVRFRVSAALGFPALWILFEWLRSWLLTGFPWLQIGYAHTDTALAGWAPVTGLYGVSFISALSSSLLFIALSQLIAARKKQAAATLCGLLIPWGCGSALQQIEWTNDPTLASSPPLKVTLFQPNIPQDIKWQPQQRNKTLRLLRDEALQHPQSDLLVWPENAIPLFHHQATDFIGNLDEFLKHNTTSVISGIPWRSIDRPPPGVKLHNSSFAFGNGSGVYHKQKLVPFGEYVPLQQLLRGVIRFFDLPMSDFRPGPAEQPPLVIEHRGKPLSIMPYICYEIAYPDFVRRSARDSQLLVTISDDSWFGRSIGPHQHLQMARMRALENARYLLRSTNTGITAIIDPRGNIQAQAKPFERSSITDSISIQPGITLYSRVGSWPILLLAFGLLWATKNHPRKN